MIRTPIMEAVSFCINTIFMIRHCLVIILALSFGVCAAQKQPNILWITCEDMSPHLGSYGETVAKTPHLDALAKDGIRFTNAYTTAGVCAPSRAAIITGMYQTFLGAQNMRVHRSNASANNYPVNFLEYEAVPPSYVKAFPEYLRAAGYYCTNNAKTDYQFQAPPTVWDESNKKAHYRNRPDKGQPFFSVFNIEATHEGQVKKLQASDLLVDPKDVQVPPYYPDTKLVRDNIARFLTNVMRMDQQAGALIAELKREGLYDNTIIFFYADHGDALPYVKREVLKRGIHVPLLVKMPAGKGEGRGVVNDRMISFIDLAPTVLALAGVNIPEYMPGRAFLGAQAAKTGHKYIFAARDRMDADYEMIRSVHDGRYQLVRNYYPNLPRYQNNAYRIQQQPMMAEMLEMKAKGELKQPVLRWFESKPVYELYDMEKDPYEFEDLAGNKAYADKLSELQGALEAWTKKYDPYEEVPEMEMVSGWWGGKKEAPKTEKPVIELKNGIVTIECSTEGASIGYRTSETDKWKVYTGPFKPVKGSTLFAIAQRIGYKPSMIVKH